MAEPASKKENPLINILVNIAIPTIIMIKLSDEQYLGPKIALVLALAFPLCYGIWDYSQRKKVNLFSALGFISVLLTGGISLLELDPKYIAIKEAAIPGILGLATFLSMYTRYPLVKTLLLNDSVMEVDKINAALEHEGNQEPFRKVLMNSTYLVTASFTLSSALNYILAKTIVVAPAGSEEYTQQLGKMNALSFPVIALPTMIILIVAMIYLFKSITRLTNLPLEELMVTK
jgi:hypothetical protein